ncbi:MAG: hypothetical protein ACRCU3_05960 [Eubacteriaceae bacterium]
MNNNKNPKNKVDIILEKKQGLDETILEYEKRIDEKLASLSENDIISRELNPDLFEANIQEISLPEDHYLSGIDISDDDALDQAILNSKPPSTVNKLAFKGDPFDNASDTSPIFADLSTFDDDDELPTLSKILGRSPEKTEISAPKEVLLAPEEDVVIPQEITIDVESHDILPPLEVEEDLPPLSIAPDLTEESPQEKVQEDNKEAKYSAFFEEPSEEPIFEENVIKNKPEVPTPPIKKQAAPEKPPTIPHDYNAEASINKRESQAYEAPEPHRKNPDLKIRDLIIPLVFFILGIITLGGFLTLSSPDFTFVDYSVLFILFTCLIFTIAMPLSASLFLMTLLLCSYISLSLISIFYIGLPFEPYQIGWIIVIPLLLWSSALLVQKFREIFSRKRALESELASLEQLEESPGLTIEKAYYKDLKYAMERGNKGETILVLEMICISHLETLKSMTGPRLWDEILYKTLNIIKKHCFNTHLIYILEGNVFSILMENTSMKNQLMINQGIIEDFNTLISEYSAIDFHVELDIVSVPFSREIRNPFDYRGIGMRLLKK